VKFWYLDQYRQANRGPGGGLSPGS
jgi:hypothetical protein